MQRVSRATRRRGRIAFARSSLSLLARSGAAQHQEGGGDTYRLFIEEWPLFQKVGDWVAENCREPEWLQLSIDYPAAVRRFGWAFSPYQRLLDADLLPWWRAALVATEQLGDDGARGKLLLELGTLHAERNERPEAIACLEKAVALFRERGDRRSEALALLGLGRAFSGRVAGPTSAEGAPRSLQAYDEAVAIFAALGDRTIQAAALMELGQFLRDVGQLVRSVECAERALTLAPGSPDPELRMNVLFELACLHRDLGALREAVRRCDEVLGLFRARRQEAREQERPRPGDLGVIPGATEEKTLHAYRYQETTYFLHHGELDGTCCRDATCCHGRDVDRGPRLPALGVAVIDPRYAGVFLLNLGSFYAQLGAVRRAAPLFHEARELLLAVGDEEGASMAAHNLSRWPGGSLDLEDGLGPVPLAGGARPSPGAGPVETTGHRPCLADLFPLLDPGEVPVVQRLLESEPVGSERLVDLEGVRLLREGKVEQAVQVFRSLVVGPALCLRRDLPARSLANFATALLLDQNVDGCRGVLDELRKRGQSTPQSDELERCIRQWRQGLSWCDWLKGLFLGSARPIQLSFRPGEIGSPDR